MVTYYQCQMCGEMFNTQNEAVQHLENTHYAQPVQAWDIFALTYVGGSFSFIAIESIYLSTNLYASLWFWTKDTAEQRWLQFIDHYNVGIS